jgi:glycerol-3-phosphate dehydrogenase (NAD(P)+)
LDQPLDKKIIFSAVKGVIPETMLIVGEHFKTKYNVSLEKFGVISGPSHAEEIAMERLSYSPLPVQIKNWPK